MAVKKTEPGGGGGGSIPEKNCSVLPHRALESFRI